MVSWLGACAGAFAGVYYTPPTPKQLAAGRYNLTTIVGPCANGTAEGKPGQLWLLTNETELTLEVFTDIAVVEAYFQGGRSVTTGAVSSYKHPVTIPEGSVQGSMSIFNNGSAGLEVKAEVWTMSSIWATKEEVLATPPDPGTGKAGGA